MSADPVPFEGRADLSGDGAQLVCDWTELDPDGLLDRLGAAFPDFPKLAEWRDALRGLEDWDSREWEMIEHCINLELAEASACTWDDNARPCFSFDPTCEDWLVLAPLAWWKDRDAEADKLREQWRQEQLIRQRDERRGLGAQIGLDL